MECSSSLLVGFSSGSLGPGRPSHAIDQAIALRLRVIELSALRVDELDGIEEVLEDPRLDRFDYVSIHAPSRFAKEDEEWLVDRLVALSGGRRPVVVHPDTITQFELWQRLGDRLLLENMDRRKPIGRFAHEFDELFERLPQAGLCLDVAHARQVDPSMTEAMKFLRKFPDRLREIHISEVGSDSSHSRLTDHGALSLRELLQNVPIGIPVVIESVLGNCLPVQEVTEVENILLSQAQAF